MNNKKKFLAGLLGSVCLLSGGGCSILPVNPIEGKEIVEFNIAAEEGGTFEIVSGQRNTYIVGDEVTVKAIAYEHYSFVGWVNKASKNPKEIISTQLTYTFKLTDNTDLVAVFYIKTQLPIYAHIPTELGEFVTYYGSKESGDYTWLSLDDVTMEYWTFGGWFLDDTYETKLDATNLDAYLNVDPKPTQIDIYAKLTHNEVKVNFVFYVVNGETELVTEGITNPNVGPFYEGKELVLKDASMASTETYAYDFQGWFTDEGLTTSYTTITLSDEVTIYGKFLRRNITKHTVTWKVNGDVVETDESVVYGSVPTYDSEQPSKDKTAQYTYSFKGWKVEGTDDSAIITLGDYKVTEDVIFVAVFEESVNSYTVKFVDYDGTTVLKEETLNYGETPTAPTSTPNHGGLSVDPRDEKSFYDDTNLYTFTGWDKDISSVTGDTTYTATYSTRALYNYSYTIKVVGDVLNGTSWSGHAKELHEDIIPTSQKIDNISYKATYYKDEAMTTEMTDELLATALDKDNTLVIYVTLEHTHTWDNGKVTKEATCEETGTKLYTCSECGNTKEEEIPATGHNYGDVQRRYVENSNSIQEYKVCANDSSHEEIVSTNELQNIATFTVSEANSSSLTSYNAYFYRSADYMTIAIKTVDGTAWNSDEKVKIYYDFGDGKNFNTNPKDKSTGYFFYTPSSKTLTAFEFYGDNEDVNISTKITANVNDENNIISIDIPLNIFSVDVPETIGFNFGASDGEQEYIVPTTYYYGFIKVKDNSVYDGTALNTINTLDSANAVSLSNHVFRNKNKIEFVVENTSSNNFAAKHRIYIYLDNTDGTSETLDSNVNKNISLMISFTSSTNFATHFRTTSNNTYIQENGSKVIDTTAVNKVENDYVQIHISGNKAYFYIDLAKLDTLLSTTYATSEIGVAYASGNSTQGLNYCGGNSIDNTAVAPTNPSKYQRIDVSGNLVVNK